MFINEVGNLSQGVCGHVKVTRKIYLTKHKDTPEDQADNYGRIVLNYLPQKEDSYQTCLTLVIYLIN